VSVGIKDVAISKDATDEGAGKSCGKIVVYIHFIVVSTNI
jgi:hypothetical protein